MGPLLGIGLVAIVLLITAVACSTEDTAAPPTEMRKLVLRGIALTPLSMVGVAALIAAFVQAFE